MLETRGNIFYVESQLHFNIYRCLGNKYDVPEHMKAAVIIAFFNETQDNLFRTILSVVKKTTRKYLAEVIVIDDCSFDGECLLSCLYSAYNNFNVL